MCTQRKTSFRSSLTPPPPTPHLPQPVPGLQWVKQSLIVNDAMMAVD